MLFNQTNYSTNYQGGNPNNISNFNSSINNGIDINKYCNKYSRANMDRDSNVDKKKLDIALDSKKGN